jgi:hypothetical protein
MNLQILAREPHHQVHAKAIADKLGLEVITKHRDLTADYVMVFSYGDLRYVDEMKNKGIIFCEHGAGFYYSDLTHPSYAGSTKNRNRVILRLSPNETHAQKERETLDCPVEVIGIPKLDKFANRNWYVGKNKPTIAFSFHFDCFVCPETRSSFNYFKNKIPELARTFNIIGHAHPRLMPTAKDFYYKNRIKVEEDFENVIEKADVYICDNSSTIYEFLITEKPVVLLNPPFYRREIEHAGNPRFWKHSDVGPLCDRPEDLEKCIWDAIHNREKYLPAIRRANKAVLTFTDGKCAERASEIVKKYLQ